MTALLSVPLERLLKEWWNGLDIAHKRAFLAAACVSLLAFGFEMTNLTLHHDDLNHLLVQKPLVGYYLGRFVHAWLFFYGQQGQFAPFLDMTVGILLMCLYGVLVARFWGARGSAEMALVAMVVCVFPYMAHVYQYNSVMIAYPLAHLLAAAGVILAARARPASMTLAALSFFAAFSIYQAVLANAATLFVIWLLTRTLRDEGLAADALRRTARSAGAVLVAVIVGGILHVVAVSSLNIPFDAAQGADQAFSVRGRLDHGLQLGHAAAQVLNGTRAFFFWPETYLPQWLKLLHQALVAAAALCCLMLPRSLPAKATALVLLGLALLAPRTVQFLHPQANFHQLTLTAYALVIAASVLLILRTGRTLVRNATLLLSTLLLAGYVMQCGWISTVNYLNTAAHYATMTQILARLRALPDPAWDGETVLVVGRYDMPSEFPFKGATGVASEYIDPAHMNMLARLMRDEVQFRKADASMPGVLAFAASRKAWPNPGSVGIVDGVGVVVLSSPAGNDVPAGSQ